MTDILVDKSRPTRIEILCNFIFFVAVDCGSLPAPMNGSSHGVATVFPNGIQFSCEPGFILSGSAKRTCQPNGTWSGVTTVCTGRIYLLIYILQSRLAEQKIFPPNSLRKYCIK